MPRQRIHQPQLTDQLIRLLDALHELARETAQTRQLFVTAPLLQGRGAAQEHGGAGEGVRRKLTQDGP
jgi:hypothetical protein